MGSPSDVSGRWTYRSFHNDPDPVGGDPDKALGLFFAEAVFDLNVEPNGDLSGTIDWGSGGLDLKGKVSANNALLLVEMAGSGRPATETDKWEYDYYGWLAYEWPSGVSQVPAIVGSVIRAKPHGSQAAGYVASFVAVRRSA